MLSGYYKKIADEYRIKVGDVMKLIPKIAEAYPIWLNERIYWF